MCTLFVVDGVKKSLGVELPITLFSTCDNDALCQQVLREGRSNHVFTDVMLGSSGPWVQQLASKLAEFRARLSIDSLGRSPCPDVAEVARDFKELFREFRLSFRHARSATGMCLKLGSRCVFSREAGFPSK